jgi:hypothetical protein
LRSCAPPREARRFPEALLERKRTQSASTAAKAAETIAAPALGRTAAAPVSRVIEPPSRSLGAAYRAHAQLVKNLPSM